MEAMRNLVPWRIGVAVHCNNLNTQALKGDDHFFAQLTTAQQHHFDGVCSQRCTDLCWKLNRCCHAQTRLIKSLRSEEHTSELQSLMRISYAVFCLKKKKTTSIINID